MPMKFLVLAGGGVGFSFGRGVDGSANLIFMGAGLFLINKAKKCRKVGWRTEGSARGDCSHARPRCCLLSHAPSECTKTAHCHSLATKAKANLHCRLGCGKEFLQWEFNFTLFEPQRESPFARCIYLSPAPFARFDLHAQVVQKFG